MILADDMGFSDARCYGGDIDTPNISCNSSLVLANDIAADNRQPSF